MSAERSGDHKLTESTPARSAAAAGGGADGADLSREQRTRLRAETIDRLGEVAVNPGPLLEVLRAPADDPDALTAALERCPALTARVLSVTNSAAVRTGRPIANVRRAVIHLGARRTRAIAMAFGLRVLAQGAGLPARLAQRLWSNSLHKAAAARLVAEIVDPRHADDAFCTALIQDVGLPMLVAVDPGFYTTQLVPGAAGSWSRQEKHRFGITHAEVGFRLLTSWKASSSLIEAVLHHHRAPTGLDGDQAMTRIPTFMASLMPHLDEEPTGTERDWITTLHAKFLYPTHDTPEAFFAAAANAAGPLLAGAGYEESQPALIRKLIRAVASDTVSMVTQLCRLETALCRQREGFDELRFQAFTDPLTKVLNRRGFTQLAERRLDEAVRKRLGTCCLVLDLDDFKPINDRLGHEAGDMVLRGLAKLLRRTLDRNDLIGRLGGDEFVVLLTALDEAKAREVAVRLAKACTGTRIRLANGVETPVRLSLGAVHVAEMDPTLGIDDLINAADDAMYHRKRRGKGGLHFTVYHNLQSDATGEFDAVV